MHRIDLRTGRTDSLRLNTLATKGPERRGDETMPSKESYGSNPNAGVDSNNDHGWGGYQWPGGVPGNLLATAVYRGSRSVASCVCRKELVELFQLGWQLADTKYNYPVYGSPCPSGEPTWGPWGYENRAIGGTSSPSNHSRGKAMDVNAPRNPQSYTFQSDMPVGWVNAMETCGFYWGGRYGGGTKYDTMHFEYCYSPANVPGHVARMKALLGGTPPTGTDDWTDQMSKAEWVKIVQEAFPLRGAS